MRSLRPLLACASLGLLVWRLVQMVLLVRSIRANTGGGDLPYNPLVQKAIDLLLAQSALWAQTTTILIGVLAALWVAKAGEPGLKLNRRYWPEIVTWFAGLAMLGLGLYCHREYVEGIANALEAGGKQLAAVQQELATVPKELQVCEKGLEACATQLEAARNALEAASIRDVFTGNYEALRAEGLSMLLCGALASAMAVFSVKHLSGGSSE